MTDLDILRNHLSSILGKKKLEKIEGQLKQIVSENGLEQSPDIFEDLFIYSAWVIFERNPV